MLTERQTFTCGECRRELEASNFYWSGGRRSGYCKPCQAAYVSKQRQEATKNRDNWRRNKYGLTAEGYAQRLREQGGVCAICGAPPSGGTDNQRYRGIDPVLVVDHNHVTGEVRGLLCSGCNTLLGRVKDDAERLENAAKYLRANGFVPPTQLVPSPEEMLATTGDKVYIEALPAIIDKATAGFPPANVPPLHQALPRFRANPLVAEVVRPGNETEARISAISAAQAPTLNVPLPVESQVAEERNYRAEAMQADLLPGGGEAHQRTSEFQARRQAQIEVLQAAWSEMFAQQLTRDSAKDLLNLTDNFAEDALDAMETAKARGVNSPRGYIVKMLTNKRAQGQQTVRPVSLGKPGQAQSSDDEAGPGGDNYWREPSEKYKRIQELARQRGLMVEDDD